jgi:branched-chain amino acid transport system permease protein
VVGGLGSIRGTIIAAVLVVLVPRWLAGSGELAPLIYSVLVIVLLLFAPAGLAGASNSVYKYGSARLRLRYAQRGARL